MELREKIVSTNSDQLADSITAAVKEAREQERPFLVAWRPNARPRLQSEHDEGCGCGPADLPDPPLR